MNLDETTPPVPGSGADNNNSQTAFSESALGSRPGLVSETDVTAMPDSASNTDVGNGAAKPLDINAATITVAGTSMMNLFGQYELLGEVARGGMGVVYRARQRGLDRLVALKMVLGISGESESALQRFMIEARAAASLDHPNVVPIYDSGEVDGKLFFTMALVEGPNLKGFVETNGIPSIPHTISLFAQIVAGVAHAHAAGIIHRDLKPANVLMDKDGRPRVTDFGLAKKSSSNSELTGTGQIMGTPAYMPPEQARDSKDVGPPADVYSLGAILYYLMTGRPPFIGESVPDLLIKVVSETPDSPSLLNNQIPPDLEALCLRCLAKKAGDRFADARGLAEAMLPIVDTYVPRSSHSLHSIGRSSGSFSAVGATGSMPSGLISTMANASAVSPPPAKSKLRILALSCTAGLLAAAALYLLVIAPPKKVDETKGSLALIGEPASLTPGQGKTTPVSITTGSSEKTLEWPTLAASDFKLKTELTAVAPTDANGVLLLSNQSVLKLKLTAEKDCHAAVFWVDPKGDIVQIFPNRLDKDSRLLAGQERVIPGGGKEYDLVVTPTEGTGPESLRIVATTGAMPNLPGGSDEGAYTAFKTKTQKEQIVSNVRGILVRKKSTGTTEEAPQVAEAEIKFRVNP